MLNFSRITQRRLCRFLFPLASLFWLISCTSYRTTPILDSQGNDIPESIANLEKIRLGNADQWILVQGYNVHNPILLKLHGGPGQADAYDLNADIASHRAQACVVLPGTRSVTQTVRFPLNVL